MAPENEARTVPAEFVTVKPVCVIDTISCQEYLLFNLAPTSIFQIFYELYAGAPHGIVVNMTSHHPYAITLP
jgi:hypothetical protein